MRRFMILNVLNILLLFLRYTIASKCNSKFWVRSDFCYQNDTDVDAVIPYVSSLAVCITLCCENPTCVAVIYDDVSDECQTISKFSLFTEPNWAFSEFCTLKYAEFIQSTCKTPSTLNALCNTDSDCRDTGSTCNGNQCVCAAGFSYNPSNNTCLEFCETYGGEFEKFAGHLVIGFNNVMIPNSDAQACIDSCTNTTSFVCRTVEMSVTGDCFLSEETATTRPDKYLASPEYDYYQRNCA